MINVKHIIHFQKRYMKQTLKKILGAEADFICGDAKYNILEISNKKILIPQKHLIRDSIKECNFKNKIILEFHQKRLFEARERALEKMRSRAEEESKSEIEQINTEGRASIAINTENSVPIANEIKDIKNYIKKYDKINQELRELENRYDRIGFTKQKHGFSGWIIRDKIYYTFHTTKNTSQIWGIETKNIAINESLNPITHVNSIQMMEVEDFKKYFKLTNPDHMLESPRYGKCEKGDLAYCSLRALCKSIYHSPQVLQIKEMDEGELGIFLKNIFTIDERDIIKLPAAAIISEEVGEGARSDFFEKTMQVLEEKGNSTEFKEGLRAEALETYRQLREC